MFRHSLDIVAVLKIQREVAGSRSRNHFELQFSVRRVHEGNFILERLVVVLQFVISEQLRNIHQISHRYRLHAHRKRSRTNRSSLYSTHL